MSSSVLSRLGNPLAYHVLPSRRAASVAQDTGMPPPPPKRMGSAAAAAAGGPSQDRREVLPTLAYEEALESIIESTFFPDLPRMTQQLAWLDALSSGDPSQIHHAREGIASSIRRSHGVVSATPQGSVIGGAGGGAAQRGLAHSRPLLEDGGGSLVSWSAGLRVPPHPTLPGAPGGGGGGSVRGGSVFMQGGSVVGGASRGAPLALSSFQASFTSEDHAVFQQNMRLVNLKQRLWWVSDATAPAAPLLLGDAPRGRGLLMNKREGAIVPFSAAPTTTTTTTTTSSSNPTESMGVLQMWKWRPKNALFFPPSLEASYDTSRVSQPLALSSRYSGLELAMPTRVRDGGPPPPPPRLSATRFNSQAVKQAVEMEVEAQAKQILKASDAQAGFNLWPGGGCGPISSTGRSYSLLPTPIIQPFSSEESSRSGGGSAQQSSSSSSSALIQVSPIITWGEVAGTPIMLDPPPPPPIPTKALDLAAAFGMSGDDIQQSGGGGGFTMPPPSSRAATHDTLLKAIGERNEGGGGRRMGGAGRGGGAPLPPHPSLPVGGTSRRTGTVLGTEGVTPIYAASAFAPGGGMGGGHHHHHHHHPPAPSRSSVAGSVSGRRSAVTGVSAATSRVMHALSAMPPSARALLLRQQQAHGRGEEGGELKGVFSGGGGRKRQRE